MKTFKVINDDLVFDLSGNLVMVEGKEEEAQCIERIFSTNTNEFFLNPDHGFNYEALKVKNPDHNLIRLALISAATQDKRVKTASLTGIDLNKSERSAVVRFKITMKSGNTIESEVSL